MLDEQGVPGRNAWAATRRLRIGGTSAWFKKCHFQVTPEIDKALEAKGFLVLGVTLI
jgi:hypothetical protein